MLHSLSPEMLQIMEDYKQYDSSEEGDQDHQDHQEHYEDSKTDLEKGQLEQNTLTSRDQRKRSNADDSAGSRMTNSKGEEIPPDVRQPGSRPVPQAVPEDKYKHKADVPADIRRESMRPTTGVPPKERKEDGGHDLAPSSTRTSRQTIDEAAMGKLKQQASEPGHKEISKLQEDQSKELRNRWAR